MQQPVDFADIARRLKARRDELNGRLSEVRADQHRVREPLSLDSADRATQRENDDVIDAIGLSVESEIMEIKSALSRIEAGTYGRCTLCGSRISVVRLLVFFFVLCCCVCVAAL